MSMKGRASQDSCWKRAAQTVSVSLLRAEPGSCLGQMMYGERMQQVMSDYEVCNHDAPTAYTVMKQMPCRYWHFIDQDCR